MRNFMLGVLLGCCFLVLEAATARSTEIGTGLICNTVAQVEQYVEAHGETRSVPAALYKVNSMYPGDTNVCAVVSIAYEHGKIVKTISGFGGRYDIVEIVLIGMPIGIVGGIPVVSQLPEPIVQYTLFNMKGEDA